ncbi:MAG TPA: LPXTG cell wall anchor domain-containing protein [Acidimicrobiales bacterium]|nr:LPXTG cell wall anchor domain-containing protein [Acidimicrobiales bacterium]
MKSTKRRTPLVLIAAVLALACGLFTVTSSTAGAADACVVDPNDYGSSVVLGTSATSADNGTSVDIIGSGFPADCDVTLEVDGATIATVTTGADGAFSYTWDIPGDAEPGSVTIAATAAGQVLATTTLEIVDAQPTTTPGSATTVTGTNGGGTGTSTTGGSTLPATGAQIAVLVVGGLVMLAAGAALLMWNRGRRVSTQI